VPVVGCDASGGGVERCFEVGASFSLGGKLGVERVGESAQGGDQVPVVNADRLASDWACPP